MKKDVTLQVLLVRPEDDGNIGAVCRAMKTTGIQSLGIAGKTQFDTNIIRTFALHAFNIFEGVELFQNIEEALADTTLSAGLTRRKGKRRKYISYSPEILAKKVQTMENGKVTLVFGNEEHGLTDEELACCDMAVAVPTSGSFPSLNLSHAVQIIGYVLFRGYSDSGDGSKEFPLPPIGEKAAGRRVLMETVTEVTDSMEKIGFFSFSGREGKEETARFLRDILARALISAEEAARIRQIARKTEGLANKREKKEEYL